MPTIWDKALSQNKDHKKFASCFENANAEL
jgi:hypothetical protein